MDTGCNPKKENENQTIEDFKVNLHPKSSVKKSNRYSKWQRGSG